MSSWSLSWVSPAVASTPNRSRLYDASGAVRAWTASTGSTMTTNGTDVPADGWSSSEECHASGNDR